MSNLAMKTWPSVEVYTPPVIVKLKDTRGPFNPTVDEVRSALSWDEIVRQLPQEAKLGIFLLINGAERESLLNRLQRTPESDPNGPGRRLLKYATISFDGTAVKPDDVIAVVRRVDAGHQEQVVEIVYAKGAPAPPPLSIIGSNPRSIDQDYLDAYAAGGVGAAITRNRPGASGAGINLGDIEQGWWWEDAADRLMHEDLNNATATRPFKNQEWMHEADHGTHVLGVLLAQDNHLGIVGLVPDATTFLVSQWIIDDQGNKWDMVEVAIERISPHLGAGGVLLLEAESSALGTQYLPVETEPAVFDAIQRAVIEQIIVVEAAGNAANGGGTNLDPIMAGLGDSGAIMVGACDVNGGLVIGPTSNFGQRVNCFAWGQNIESTKIGLGDGGYFHDFDGTSGAAAIVAGIAVSLRGIAAGAGLSVISPGDMRRYLSDPHVNTTAIPGIGVLPNMERIIADKLHL